MSNPIFNKFANNENKDGLENSLAKEPMTVSGTINVTLMLGIILIVSAGFVWSQFAAGYNDMANMLMIGGLIAAVVSYIILLFTRSKILIPIYAVGEGFAIGGLSCMFEAQFPGIVIQAVAGTFAALFSMLILYKFNVIKCTDKFRSVIFIATLSIAGMYLIDIIGMLFHHSVPFLHSSSPFGLLVSAVIIIIAALNLIIDFDFIERGAQNMLPKDMEWFGGFALIVTLVWLYLEILDFLAKLNRK